MSECSEYLNIFVKIPPKNMHVHIHSGWPVGYYGQHYIVGEYAYTFYFYTNKTQI